MIQRFGRCVVVSSRRRGRKRVCELEKCKMDGKRCTRRSQRSRFQPPTRKVEEKENISPVLETENIPPVPSTDLQGNRKRKSDGCPPLEFGQSSQANMISPPQQFALARTLGSYSGSPPFSLSSSGSASPSSDHDPSLSLRNSHRERDNTIGLSVSSNVAPTPSSLSPHSFPQCDESPSRQNIHVSPCSSQAWRVLPLQPLASNGEEEGDQTEDKDEERDEEGHQTEDKDEERDEEGDQTEDKDEERDEEEEEKDEEDRGDEEGSSDEDGSDEEGGPPRKRMRRYVRQTTSQTRQARKTARNRGEEYVTAKGKIVPRKAAETLTSCRLKCFEKIPTDVCEEICDSVWKNLGDANARRAYITGQIQSVPKKFERTNVATAPGAPRKRQYSFEYHVCVNGANIKVCKSCFLKVYQVSRKFVELAQKQKLENPAGVSRPDARGSASKSAEEESLQFVIDHINSFPKYQSHYARERTDSNFLPAHLNEKIMYDEYLKKADKPLSRWIYAREIKKLGLKFKALQVDTCHNCDALQAAVKYYNSDEERHESLIQQELHHKKAEEAIKTKKGDKKMAQENDNIETIAFDLQQCLPTPNLSTSIVFYLRQLWVYNLTIHVMSSGESVHNMWHEGEGGRGANQVGSALYKYIMNLPDQIEHLILWSDTCGGQNKNGIITTVLITALSHKRTLKTIDQKFLVPGHTHLECDSDHAVIENRKKKESHIHVPRDWYNLVRNASKKFTVQPLNEDQLNFKALHTGRDSPLVKRKLTTSKIKFIWKNVVWMQLNRNLEPGVVAFKTSFKEDEDFEYLDMRRRKRIELVLSPSKLYDGPVKISAKKKKDLLSMLHLLDPQCHSFYTSLETDEAIPEDIDPDIGRPVSDEEDSGEE